MTIEDAKRRLKNAKQRALFWSGNPSFTGKRFRPTKSRKSHAEQYELALDDIDSLSSYIEELTGFRPKAYDPKARCQSAWSRLMESLPPTL